MTRSAKSMSRYDQRVQLAADALMRDSGLSRETAVAYAKQVLYAVDHIPEYVR